MIEEKIRKAKPSTWLTDGLTTEEVQVLVSNIRSIDPDKANTYYKMGRIDSLNKLLEVFNERYKDLESAYDSINHPTITDILYELKKWIATIEELIKIYSMEE